MLKPQHLRLLIAPVLLALADCAVTLWYQPPGYWSGQPGAVIEAQPLANRVMAFHPAVHLVFHALWIASFCFLILVLPRRPAIFIAAVVTIGHTMGAWSWLRPRVPYQYQAGNALAILSALCLAASIPLLPLASDEKASAARRGRFLWPKRLLIAALIGIPIYVCAVPQGKAPQETSPTAKAAVSIPYGSRAGETGAVQWPKHISGIGGTTARYGMWGDAPAFVVWADSGAVDANARWGGSDFSARGPHKSRGEYDTEIYLQPGKSVKLHSVIFEDEFGQIATFEMNGQLYDLNRGGLFLAAVQGKDIQILQLKSDLSKLSPDKEGFEKFAEAHPDVKAFFAMCRAGRGK